MSIEEVRRVTCDICGHQAEFSMEGNIRMRHRVPVANEYGTAEDRTLDLCHRCYKNAVVIKEKVIREPTGRTLPPDFYEQEMVVVDKKYEWLTNENVEHLLRSFAATLLDRTSYYDTEETEETIREFLPEFNSVVNDDTRRD